MRLPLDTDLLVALPQLYCSTMGSVQYADLGKILCYCSRNPNGKTARPATNIHQAVSTTLSTEYPGYREVAVKEYGEWLASMVSDYTLQAAFRQAGNVELSYGFGLKHIYKDQNPEFFVGKG